MKLTIPAIGVLTSIVLLASVGVLYASSTGTGLSLNESAGPVGAAYMVGNVKVTQFDELGNVIALRHGSNHITGTGMQVIMGQVFTDMNGTFPDAVANITGRVGWMEIGTEGDPVTYTNQLRWNNTDIIAPVGSPCIRVEAGITNTTGTTVHKGDSTCAPRSACNARYNVTAVAQFDGAICGAVGIDEAGIFTASTAEGDGLLFARNVFGSVNLGPLDTLQLEWEFTFKDS